MTDASYKRFVMAHLQQAGLRARYLTNVARMLWKAVRDGELDPDIAIALLDDANGIDLLLPDWDGTVPVSPPQWVRKHVRDNDLQR